MKGLRYTCYLPLLSSIRIFYLILSYHSRKMKKSEISRQIQVVHQIVSLTGINFTTKSIIGFVELTVIPLKVSIRDLGKNGKSENYEELVPDCIL